MHDQIHRVESEACIDNADGRQAKKVIDAWIVIDIWRCQEVQGGQGQSHLRQARRDEEMEYREPGDDIWVRFGICEIEPKHADRPEQKKPRERYQQNLYWLRACQPKNETQRLRLACGVRRVQAKARSQEE